MPAFHTASPACAPACSDGEGRLPVSDYAVKMPWSEEALVTVIDLEDKRTAGEEEKEEGGGCLHVE